MHNLQPSLAGRDYTLFAALPGCAEGSAPAVSEWRLTVSRSPRAPSPPEDEALYWDPCALP